jgi:NADH:ubiquinone oxidoreductase subunit 6 (subunit J)
MTEARILSCTIYLACVSAAVATMLYLLGAYQVAVIELSVGAGLVTVLLVYAISVVGDDATDPGPVIPRSVAVGLTLLTVSMVGYMAYSLPSKDLSPRVPTLLNALWQQRVLDVWIQMVLIFSGVLGILGLLAEGKLTHAERARHDGNGHRTVKVVPPTACGFVAPQTLRAEELHKDEVHV